MNTITLFLLCTLMMIQPHPRMPLFQHHAHAPLEWYTHERILFGIILLLSSIFLIVAIYFLITAVRDYRKSMNNVDVTRNEYIQDLPAIT